MGVVVKRVAVDGGASLATEAVGTPGTGTILLAMRATASMVWWPDALVAALAEGGYQVIKFDHRDTGQSTTNPPGEVGYDIYTLTADLIAILDAYDVEAAHLVGMSLGGYVLQIAALRHPDRVLSLGLISSEPLGIEYESQDISAEFMEHFAGMGELDWSDRDAVTAFMLRSAELNAGPAVPFDRDAALNRIERELARAENIQSAFNHAMVGGDLQPDLVASAIDVPVAIIHGSADPIISVNAARATATAIASSDLLVLDGRGHEILETDVPQIAAVILANAARGN